jgi:hypothetical protein
MKPDSSSVSAGFGFECQLMTALFDLWVRQALVRRMTRITREANRPTRSMLLERQVALTRRRRRQLSKTTDSMGPNEYRDEFKETLNNQANRQP